MSSIVYLKRITDSDTGHAKKGKVYKVNMGDYYFYYVSDRHGGTRIVNIMHIGTHWKQVKSYENKIGGTIL